MPMLDAYIPRDALDPDAEQRLLARLTDLLIEHEGADPSNENVRSIAWVFLHRPEIVFVAGEPAAEPRYRFIASVPEGQFDDERRRAMVASVTAAVLEAEGAEDEGAAARVWVFAREVPDGTWGALGQIFTLADIAGFALGDAERGRAHAEERLAGRRQPVLG